MADYDTTPVARLRPGGRGAAGPALRTRRLPSGPAGAGGKPRVAGPLVREWHAMTPTDRKAAWIELVEWVIWLHDRYELATEHRLPQCWPLHPGLIEELAALKAWRGEIYTADQPAGQAARYWHAELRHVIHAATTIYAAGCRAGHRTPAALAAADTDLCAQWLRADPLAAVPAALLASTAKPRAGDQRIGDPMIHDALHRGEARPLGQQITDYVHYRDQWWTAHPDGGWTVVTDPVFTAELDSAADRMAVADAAVAAERARRAALEGGTS
ncbi:hypothetical protein Sya03_57260 [Spirilliplanes yamanashiensis]|uniref:Uncharacterized protein n=2 Tax=Spirilliplanes yamanashiensis TaxID=42233 RepID=A0A8J4DMM7_9ACTN|nr:hypothetical protein [Spirilliplanes yamanashiensis]GIJ06374.1 hypothetical protein Sya03_57260 [Spirilliplanes yamanashiensis]